MQIVSQIFISATHEIPLRVAEEIAAQAICTEETTNKWIYYPLSHNKGHSFVEYPLFHIRFDFLSGGTSPADFCPDALQTPQLYHRALAMHTFSLATAPTG